MDLSKLYSNRVIAVFIQIFTAAAMVFVLSLVADAFSEPTQSPPDGNVAPPLNVSNVGQSKAGGLILNTGGASVGLIVDKGNVGIGTTDPTQKLDVAGFVKGLSGLCIGDDCRSEWPSGGSGITRETDPTVSSFAKKNLCYCVQVQCFGGDWQGGPQCAPLGNWTGYAACGGNDENVRMLVYEC